MREPCRKLGLLKARWGGVSWYLPYKRYLCSTWGCKLGASTFTSGRHSIHRDDRTTLYYTFYFNRAKVL
jgi:hypothetical protein